MNQPVFHNGQKNNSLKRQNSPYSEEFEIWPMTIKGALKMEVKWKLKLKELLGTDGGKERLRGST